MQHMSIYVLFTLALLTFQTVAQEKSKSGESQEQKSPKTELAKLQFLIGNFTTQVNFSATPSAPKGATGTGANTNSWALDSMFILIDEQNMNSLFGHFKQHGVLGYDLPTSQFVLTMYNNFGDHPTYFGNLSGDTLKLTAEIPLPGMSFDQKILWYKEGESVKLKVLNDFGKGFNLAFEQRAIPASKK